MSSGCFKKFIPEPTGRDTVRSPSRAGSDTSSIAIRLVKRFYRTGISESRLDTQGFTLIEIIGVLAIITILASAIVPNMVQEIRKSFVTAEETSLKTLTDALYRSVIETRVIPGTVVGDWDTAIAPYLSIPSSAIIQNKGTGTRRLISRPTNGLGGVPFNQSARFSAGINPEGTLPTNAPLQARMLLISNLTATAPGAGLNNTRFDAVWNQTGTIPNGFTESDDLRIARCSFTSLFFPVTISCTAITNTPRWSLDTEAPKSLSIGFFTVYLIKGTHVNLFIGAVPQGVIVVNGPVGCTYNGVAWSY